MPRSYAQKVKQSIDNMYRHQAQSKSNGTYLEDLIVARNRLEDYHSVLKWLGSNGYKVLKGGVVVEKGNITQENHVKNEQAAIR